MAEDDLHARIAHLRTLELQFWSRVATSREGELIREAGLNIDAQLCWGEVLFLVLGLKPAVLLSGLVIRDPSTDKPLMDLSARFLQEVLLPSGVCNWSPVKLAYHVICAHSTPNANFDGMVILCNVDHILYAMVQQVFLAESTGILSEKDVAICLDYPAPLAFPTEGVSLIEVGYFASDQVLTSYVCCNTTHDLQLVKAHFSKYAKASKSFVKLKLHISEL